MKIQEPGLVGPLGGLRQALIRDPYLLEQKRRAGGKQSLTAVADFGLSQIAVINRAGLHLLALEGVRPDSERGQIELEGFVLSVSRNIGVLKDWEANSLVNSVFGDIFMDCVKLPEKVRGNSYSTSIGRAVTEADEVDARALDEKMALNAAEYLAGIGLESLVNARAAVVDGSGCPLMHKQSDVAIERTLFDEVCGAVVEESLKHESLFHGWGFYAPASLAVHDIRADQATRVIPFDTDEWDEMTWRYLPDGVRNWHLPSEE